MPKIINQGLAAAKPREQKVTAWSFSRYMDWIECPARFAYRVFQRLPEEKGPALQRGIDIHAEAEAYLRGERALPRSLKNVAMKAREFKRAGAEAELSWQTNVSWNYLDGPFHPAVWLRLKLDVLIRAIKSKRSQPLLVIGDWKTGRPNPAKDQLQMDLYAAAVMSPKGPPARIDLVYTDHPEASVSAFYEPDEIKGLRNEWMKRVKPLMMARRFPPKPGNHCRYCSFSKAKGGPCEY